MKKEINIAIANWAGVNTGDDAIFSALLNLIRDKVSKNARIFVLADNDKLIKAKYDVEDAVRIFEFYKPNNLLKVIHFLRKSDLVVYGGGDIVSGNIQSMSFIGLTKMLGLPVMYCGVGVVPIKSWLSRFFTKLVSNLVDLITVRDENSKYLLNSWGINKPPIYVTGDLAFVLQSSGKDRISQILLREGIKNNMKIGMNVRPCESMYSFYHSNRLSYKVMAEVCDHIVEKYNAKITFFPMVTKERTKWYHKNLESDEETSQKVIDLMKNKNNAIIVKGEYTPEEIMGLLGQMDLVIAMRLHTLLLALNMGVPIVAINYAPKIESLVGSINQSEYCVSAESLHKDKLINLIDKQMKGNNEKPVSTDIQLLKQKSKANGDYIKDMLHQKKKNIWRFYTFLIPAIIVISLLNYGLVTIGKFIRVIRRFQHENNIRITRNWNSWWNKSRI